MIMKLDLTKLVHMDIVDMPSDPNGYLGNFRNTLRGAYNSNRTNETAIAKIKETLEYAVGLLAAAEIAPAPILALPAPESKAPEKPETKKVTGKTSKRAAKR